jgi:lipopolysaccharide transport system ATP-binding protein
MSDVILRVENVSKLYRLGTIGTGTFGGDVQRFWKTKILGQEDPFLKIGQTNDRTSKEKAEFVWALQDINFELKRGEVLGIIGKNGAGKSTLLKLLSRITSPTTGSIKSAGRMASLLEVGTGFHPELTGRENIFLNGAILGMTKKEIQSKFDEIVDFSGCELYIDTPTKRYSSGMTVRLGFAVAAFLDPEILVVDEVLAVGDAEFQKKAIGKMKEVSQGDGRTVLFVSHNLNSVRQLCNRALLIENGIIRFDGGVEDTISTYLLKNRTVLQNSSRFNYIGDETLPIFLNSCVFVLNNFEYEQGLYDVQEEVCIKCEFIKKNDLAGIYLHLIVQDENENIIVETDSFEHGSNVFDTIKTGVLIMDFKFPSRTFNRGKFYVSMGLSSKRYDENQIQSLNQFITFEIIATEFPRDQTRRSFTSIIPQTSYKWI